MLKTTSLTLAALLAGSAAAQTPARQDPADPKAAVPPHSAYRSAFKDYRPYVEPEIGRWRDVNNDMARLGGHAGQMGNAPGKARSPEAKPPMPAGHGVHR